MKIAILGYGIEGKALAKYFKHYGAELTICDQNPKVKVREKAKVKLGRSAFKGLKNFDMVFKSPGIPLKQLGKAASRIQNLTTLTRYFFEHCPCPIIGVTGTKGKGTTSTLIYEILKAAGYDVYLGGNIGVPPLEFLGKLKKPSWVVLELSSFQTQDLKQSPHIVVVLKTTSDHMDYHKNLKEYHYAKARLLRHQRKEDIVITNIDYSICIKIARKSKGQHFSVSTRRRVAQGAYIKQGKIILKNGKKAITIMPVKEVGLIGAHNLENVLPAVIVAGLLDVSPPTIRKAVALFKGLPHRLEHVATMNKVAYYNDSFSTTPETSIAAVQAFDAPIHLIAGGSEKFSDFKEWAKVCMAAKNLKTIILTGKQSATRMAEALAQATPSTPTKNSPLILRVRDLAEAMAAAQGHAAPRDIILLSPACASFEEFPNYKVRGETFKKLALK